MKHFLRKLNLSVTGKTSRIALLLLFQLLVAASTPATSIVVRRTPEEIVVGADSKRIFQPVGSETIVKSDNVCKIGSVGNTFFALGGFAQAYINDPDPMKLAIQACQGQKTIMDRALLLERLISPILASHMALVRQVNPVYFEKWYGQNPVFGSLFFGFEDGIPKMVYLEFWTNIYGEIVITTKRFSCPGTVPAGITQMIGMGKHEAIDTFLNGRYDFWRKVGSVDGVRRLIQIESIADDDTVGGPIDIVRIDKTGATWIQRKPACEEAKVQTP